MYLCLYVYGLVLVHYSSQVKGDEEVFKKLDDDDEISSNNNTEIVITLDSVDKELTDMDCSMEIASSPEVDDNLLSEIIPSDVFNEVDALEEVERDSRALSEEFQPTYYPYLPIFETDQQCTRADFNPYLIPSLVEPKPQPHRVPNKQMIPVKGKVTIVGSFTDFNWNIPTSTTFNEDEGIFDYNDNLGIESPIFYDNVYLPNIPFYDRPSANLPTGKYISQNRPLYDNVDFINSPFHKSKNAADKNIRSRIPVTGKLTVAATFGNCGFM